jgi:hypothetical protein
MVSLLFSTSLNSFKEIQKSLSLKHKELFNIIKGIDSRAVSVKATQDSSKKFPADNNTIDQLLKLSGQMQELNQKSFQNIQILQEKFKKLETLKLLIKPVKLQLVQTEKTVLKELKLFENMIKDTISTFKPKKSQSFEFLDIRTRLVSVLKGLVHEDTVKVFASGLKPNYPVHLMKDFYLDLLTEEPEIEINCESENKKIIHHLRFLIKSIENITEPLLKLLREVSLKCSPSQEKNEELPYFMSVTPSELKVLKLKINRLHNRGSLTDEEARNMLGKISIIPVSPNNQETDLIFKNPFENSIDEFDEGEPVTATYEKQTNALGKSFSKDLGKRLKSTKKLSKRNSTPGKKIVRNTSLPKAMILGKANFKEKSKQVKIKSKSPHSFL